MSTEQPLVATAYGGAELGHLESALYEAVAESFPDATAQEVADTFVGRYGIPSDAFYAAYDDEVSRLRSRFAEERGSAGEPRTTPVVKPDVDGYSGFDRGGSEN